MLVPDKLNGLTMIQNQINAVGSSFVFIEHEANFNARLLNHSLDRFIPGHFQYAAVLIGNQDEQREPFHELQQLMNKEINDGQYFLVFCPF